MIEQTDPRILDIIASGVEHIAGTQGLILVLIIINIGVSAYALYRSGKNK